MKHRSVLLLLSLLLLSCGQETSSSSTQTTSSEESSSIASSDKTSSQETTSSIDQTSSAETTSSEASTSSKQATSEQKYSTDPAKESLYANQKYLNYLGDIQTVWKDYRGDNVTLAIIDTGFRVAHPEFQFADGTSKILDTSAYFTSSSGKVSVTQGKERVGIADGDSHGTICATVAAGSVTGEGTVGVAPNCNLMLLKVDRKPASIAAAIKYAANNGAKVLTISIGSYYDGGGDLNMDCDSETMVSLFNEAGEYAHKKGMVLVSAAGNGGLESKPTDWTYPGASDYFIGAGGLAKNSRTAIWSGSSYNSSSQWQFCDVFAPAEDLYSGCYFDRDGKHYDYDGGFNGTSFASPIIAGAACLYFQKNPNATNIDFERALFRSASPLSGERGGYGAIHMSNLMDYKPGKTQEKTFYFKDASWWRADGAKTSLYAWNFAHTNENATYPGQMMTDIGNNTYKLVLDVSLYDYITFTRVSPANEDWGAQTVDIKVADFGSKNGYTIASTTPVWKTSGQVQGSFTNL